MVLHRPFEPAAQTGQPDAGNHIPGEHDVSGLAAIMATYEASGIAHPMNAAKGILIASLFLCTANAFAQSVEKDPAAIVELGGAANWNVKDGSSSFGPSAAVEVTPIEKWLELEAGVTPLFSKHTTEWDIDLLFKKPWTLSKKRSS